MKRNTYYEFTIKPLTILVKADNIVDATVEAMRFAKDNIDLKYIRKVKY